MKRTTVLFLALLLGAMALCSGCVQLASSASQQRTATSSMADSLGPTGMSHDSKRYMANDPP
ncbi:MAG TPA: hypothetical protein VHX44_04790 [Planctomycetota bacterium]|jgi:uncharacterized membrane protein HdeD (DUF308 family)|nr:hypothetical protein [Planctomycetota bacterium]